MKDKPTKSTSIKLAQDLVRFLEERLYEKLTSVILFSCPLRLRSKRRKEAKREINTNEIIISYWSFVVRQEFVTEIREINIRR